MSSSSLRSEKPRRCFTLVELMVVVVIIGLLAGAVTVSVRGYLVKGKQSVARLEIAKLSQAVETFYTTMDRYPTNEEGINILAVKSDDFPDGLVNKIPLDPWGNAYEYSTPGPQSAYLVKSMGADGREGGQGADRDITNVDEEAGGR